MILIDFDIVHRLHAPAIGYSFNHHHFAVVAQ